MSVPTRNPGCRSSRLLANGSCRGRERSWWPSVLPRLSQASLVGPQELAAEYPGHEDHERTDQPPAATPGGAGDRGVAGAPAATPQPRRAESEPGDERPRARGPSRPCHRPPSAADCTVRLPHRAGTDSIGRSAEEPARSERGEPGGKAIDQDVRKSVLALLLGVSVVAGGCQKKDAAPSPAVARGDDDRGREGRLRPRGGDRPAGGQQTKALDLSPAEIEILKKGVAASLAGQAESEIAQYGRSCRRGPRPTRRRPPPRRRRRHPASGTPPRRAGGGQAGLRPRLQDDHSRPGPEPQGDRRRPGATTAARWSTERSSTPRPGTAVRHVPARRRRPC